jgi:hypothetical protein
MLIWIWFVFAVVFLYLGYVHWRYGNIEMRTFQVRQKGEGEVHSNLEAWSQDLNGYLQALDKQHKAEHRGAMIGYFIAGALALISALLQV